MHAKDKYSVGTDERVTN